MNEISDSISGGKFSGNLIIILGPTASGKTKVAIKLAKQLNTVIISADSRQFYKEIPIGTAAPDKEEQDGVKHYFIGNLSIKDYYNVSKYEQDVLELLDKQLSFYKNVIVVGGSGLYIDAICKGIDELPDVDNHIRLKVKKIHKSKGLAGLKEILADLDPEYLNNVDAKNPMRLMRAIEVCLQTGKTYTSLRKEKSAKRNFNIIKIGLFVDRSELIERINKRAGLMFEEGWIEEAENLYKYREHNALNTVGYKELFDYFDGSLSLEEAKEKILVSTRRYAKRQMTWFRKDKDVKWYAPHELVRLDL